MTTNNNIASLGSVLPPKDINKEKPRLSDKFLADAEAEHIDQSPPNNSSAIFSPEVPDHLRDFLSKLVNFNGNNLDPQLRKLCLICRAVLEKPELLMIFEETLEFGGGIEKNLDLLFGLLESTTIIVITKTNAHLHLYKKVLLIDAGYLFSGGNLEQLLVNEQSFMFKYLRETDLRTLHNHLNYYGIPMKSKSHSQMGKTGGISNLKQDDISKTGGLSFAGKSPCEQTVDGQSVRAESVATSKHLSERKIQVKKPGEIGTKTSPLEFQPESATLQVQRQPSIFSNISGASSGPFKLGNILREAFKINPIPADVVYPENAAQPLNQRVLITSLSGFAAPATGEGLMKHIPTISSRGHLENEDKSQHSTNKLVRSAIQIPSVTDKDLNMSDSAGLLDKLKDKATISYDKAPRLLNFLGTSGKQTTQGFNMATSKHTGDYNLKSGGEIPLMQSGQLSSPTDSRLMLSPPPERHISELQRELGVRVFPPTRVCELSKINSQKGKPGERTPFPALAAQIESPDNNKRPELFVLEEEVHITAKRRLVVSRLN